MLEKEVPHKVTVDLFQRWMMPWDFIESCILLLTTNDSKLVPLSLRWALKFFISKSVKNRKGKQ